MGRTSKVPLPRDRMPEAEVTLRLAFHVLRLTSGHATAKVAIDGAQVRVHGRAVFPIRAFLRSEGWSQTRQKGKNPWQGSYRKGPKDLVIEAQPDLGDVIARVGSRRLIAECKAGNLVKKNGMPEYGRLYSALGQLVAKEGIQRRDILIAAIPDTERFRALVGEFKKRPLVRLTKIRFALVGRGKVEIVE